MDWPHHYMDDGPCQLLVTSPDGRIRIGWFGDDFELWKISAAQDSVAAPRWTATFNHVTPAEIVAGLTTALAHDYAQAEATPSDARFLVSRSLYWADGLQPLTEAGWTAGPAEYGTVEIIAPDKQAGVLIDNRRYSDDDAAVTLWAGPPGWGTRAEAVFSSRTPSHLIAATIAAMTDPAPVVREGHTISTTMEHLVTLTPVHPPTPAASRAPTPLDVRRTAVTQGLQRAARNPQAATNLRVRAARSRTAIAAIRSDNAQPTPQASPPASLPTPAHHH